MARDELANIKVYPSATDLATSSAAILPLAPARLSTTSDCPSALESFCAVTRAIRSLPPPAGNGTTILIALTGYSCDQAVPATARMLATTARTRIFPVRTTATPLSIFFLLGSLAPASIAPPVARNKPAHQAADGSTSSVAPGLTRLNTTGLVSMAKRPSRQLTQV